MAADEDVIHGSAHGKSGGNFTNRFNMHVAKTIKYPAIHGDAVTLALHGPGAITGLFPAGSDSPVIFLNDTDPVQSILTGKLHKGRKSLGYVVLDELNDTAQAIIQLGDEFHVNTSNTGGVVSAAS